MKDIIKIQKDKKQVVAKLHKGINGEDFLRGILLLLSIWFDVYKIEYTEEKINETFEEIKKVFIKNHEQNKKED